MKTFEKELPDGYHAVRKIDVNDKKFNLKLSLAAVALMAAILIPATVMLIKRYGAVEPYLGWIILIIAIYFVLHELTHGVAYYALTKQRLKFGVSLNSLYCGLPDVYTYRSTSLAAMLAPFVLFSIIFILAILLNESPEWKMVFSFTLACHVGGCVGDLYDSGLLLFKFRDPTYLLNDAGPVQTLYAKEH